MTAPKSDDAVKDRDAVRRACVMGHPVAHSRSPILHGYWLKTLGIAGAYDRVDVTPAEFPDFFLSLQANGYVGGNITIPHKEAAFRLVHRRDEAAAAIGAVNTVWYEDSTLVGGNTDWLGIVGSLDDIHAGWDSAVRRVAVLGAGGAARAAVYGFLSRRLEVILLNRTRARAEELAAQFGTQVRVADMGDIGSVLPMVDLLINTTSLGMKGQPALAIDLAPLKRDAIVYDIVYVPLETELLRQARARGHRIVDGLNMLLYQAVPGFARWFGVKPTVTPELRALLEADIRRQTDAR